MNVTKPTHVKIILRKKGNRRIRGVPIGFVVTKANSPTVPPESTIIGKGKKGVTLPTSLPTNGRSYAQTLATMNFKKEKGSDAIPEFELPRLAQNLERKLQILDNEWLLQTSYTSDDTAALYAFFKPTQGPFVIIPSMSKDDK
jgi:calpain, invertebrate